MTATTVNIARDMEAALSEISVTNGYYTDLGMNVLRGFHAQAISSQRDVPYPYVVIRPDAESPKSVTSPSSGKVVESINFNMLLSIFTNDVDMPTEILMQCVADVRRCMALQMNPTELKRKYPALRSEGLNTPVVREVEYAQAADSQLTLATVVVLFNYLEHYEATT